MSDYRTRIAVALESGSRFAGLHASGAGVHTALVSPDGTIRFESAQVVDGHVTSIVDLNFGPDGTLYAHATTTCLVFDMKG